MSMPHKRRKEQQPIRSFFDFQKRALSLASEYYQGISNLVGSTPVEVLERRDENNDSSALRLVADSADVIQSLLSDSMTAYQASPSPRGLKRKISDVIQDSQDGPLVLPSISDEEMDMDYSREEADSVDMVDVVDVQVPTDPISSTPPPNGIHDPHTNLPLSPIVRSYVESRTASPRPVSPLASKLKTRHSWTPAEMEALRRVSMQRRSEITNRLQSRSEMDMDAELNALNKLQQKSSMSDVPLTQTTTRPRTGTPKKTSLQPRKTARASSNLSQLTIDHGFDEEFD